MNSPPAASSTNNKKNQIFILLAQHAVHHGWIFPKGLIADDIPGETKQQAALREVKEETGVTAKIIKELPPATYWYVFKNEKLKKTVYYFLMQYLKGDTAQHDSEMSTVEWLPQSQVETRLTYASDKQIWHQAQKGIIC